MSIRYRGGTGPPNLLNPLGHCCAIPCRATGSTGIVAEGEWNARQHGGPEQRIWRKIHIRCPLVVCKANDKRGIDEETLEVRAVEITGSKIGDTPVLLELLDQILSDEEIGAVTADGAYDTRKCHQAIAARGAVAISDIGRKC